MEFVLLGLLLLAFPVIAIVALVKVIDAAERLSVLERRLAALEPSPVIVRGSVPPQPEAPPAPAAAAAEPPPPPLEPEPEPPPEPATPVEPPAPAAEPEPEIGFEERFGTRWTVWIGGVALALGGIFLVKYTIEAGLIGPRLRLIFGALLAAALVVAGEWTRRQEQVTGFAGIPIAHIPSILTAAGTTIAYATVYAAYALYEYLNPGVAFVLLGAVDRKSVV